MDNIDDEWLRYLQGNTESTQHKKSVETLKPETSDTSEKLDVPECDDLYISTKTKVLFLNQEIDINNIFWKIPVIEYWQPINGIVKKQIKIVSKTPEEYEKLIS